MREEFKVPFPANVTLLAAPKRSVERLTFAEMLRRDPSLENRITRCAPDARIALPPTITAWHARHEAIAGRAQLDGHHRRSSGASERIDKSPGRESDVD